jgi:hypothetical protein
MDHAGPVKIEMFDPKRKTCQRKLQRTMHSPNVLYRQYLIRVIGINASWLQKVFPPIRTSRIDRLFKSKRMAADLD